MQSTQQIPPTLALLSIISVVGGIGNLFVILIYIRQCDKVTSNLFMTVLAGSDIFTCIFIIPTTIFIEFHEWGIGSSFVCKSYMFFNNSLIPFSALLISLIAMDRYFCICHPFLQIMNLSRSKLFICIALMLSTLLGTLASFQVHIEKKLTNLSDIGPMNMSFCVEASEWANRSMSQKLFYQITQKSQLVSYSICILIVIGLYSTIYYTVIKVRRKKDQLKGMNKMKRFKPKKLECKSHIKPKSQYRLENSDNSPIYSRFVVSNYPGCNRNVKPLGNPSTNHHHSNSPTNSSMNSLNNSVNNSSSIVIKTLKNVRDTTLLQNLKLAAMLFVVGITYIVTFLPANLMANGIIKLNLPVFYLYYVNNAANPIIYCFMNRNFRNKLKSFRFLRPVIRK
uniref:GCR110 n=1 Tax=Schmidtea mediterranea TaxID=79327 RepID=A0A193KUC3_SCHMD|nr:GCR110 [Schmidtea mediterranea]